MENEKDLEQVEPEVSKEQEYFEAAGRKFPKTPEGELQLKSFIEGMSFSAGRQSNEVGKLRPIKEFVNKALDDTKYRTEIEGLLASDDPEERKKLADIIITRDKLKDQIRDEKARVERENEKAWQDYFAKRPSIVKAASKIKLSTDDLRQKAVSSLGKDLFEAQNQEAVLDRFFDVDAESDPTPAIQPGGKGAKPPQKEKETPQIAKPAEIDDFMDVLSDASKKRGLGR